MNIYNYYHSRSNLFQCFNILCCIFEIVAKQTVQYLLALFNQRLFQLRDGLFVGIVHVSFELYAKRNEFSFESEFEITF